MLINAILLLQLFNADLASTKSATQTLQKWCENYNIAHPATIVAVRNNKMNKPADHRIRQLLQVSEKEPIAYRRVDLMCGNIIMSQADNWYVPSRLTPSINSMLENSDTPFGQAIKSLSFSRDTLSHKILWGAVEQLNSRHTPFSKENMLPSAIMEYQAILLHQQKPISYVVETYQKEIITRALAHLER